MPKFTIDAPSGAFLEGVVKDLSRVRQWVEGFEAAGKRGPAHSDGIRNAQIVLGSAKKEQDQ